VNLKIVFSTERTYVVVLDQARQQRVQFNVFLQERTDASDSAATRVGAPLLGKRKTAMPAKCPRFACDTCRSASVKLALRKSTRSARRVYEPESTLASRTRPPDACVALSRPRTRRSWTACLGVDVRLIESSRVEWRWGCGLHIGSGDGMRRCAAYHDPERGFCARGVRCEYQHDVHAGE